MMVLAVQTITAEALTLKKLQVYDDADCLGLFGQTLTQLQTVCTLFVCSGVSTPKQDIFPETIAVGSVLAQMGQGIITIQRPFALETVNIATFEAPPGAAQTLQSAVLNYR
jgi:hypothetical protein